MITETHTAVESKADRAPTMWGLVVAATLLTAGTIALVWLAAVPLGPIVCPAIYPAPRNCFTSDRAGTGLVATIVVLVIYIATMLLAFVGTHGRRPLVIAGVVLLAIAPLVSYLSVAWIPGFPLP
ncbi:hypothetical protein F6J84_03900 [Microbacterium caowuchunii]|uniref:hypothetical protein n=1 Tax=Microbacterium caowuchunii TaxID=2614638 RepID=UPI0012447AC0|nr:hypothetical protein [Microbacterium caowuchunii]QEV99337.1 hypothetical protein F6J84_03900 [Microbacterium caowuchunii]